jgi:2'-5' RNA ligase
VNLSQALLRPATALARLRPPAPYPTGRGQAQDITTIVRPPAELASAIVEQLAELRAAHAQHNWYAAVSLHATVLNLNQLAVAGLEPAVIDRLVAQVASCHRPFTVELAGLALSPSTILVRCHVAGDELWELRDELRRARRLAGARRGGVGDALKRRLVHLNVARLSAPADAALRRDVLGYSAHDFGAFTALEIELVRTDRAATPAETTLFGKHVLQR